MTAPDPLRRKALTILREGRLTVLTAKHTDDGWVGGVVARVKSSRPGVGPYFVDLLWSGQWVCTCPAGRGRQWSVPIEVCPHIAAVQIVTGHAPVTA